MTHVRSTLVYMHDMAAPITEDELLATCGKARLEDAIPLWQGAQEYLERQLGKAWPATHRVLEGLARTR